MEGKVITNTNDKKNITINNFEHRMKKRGVKKEVADLIETEKLLFNKRIIKAQNNPSPPFTITELNKVLKSLKNRKCKDPDNFVYDLFKDGVAGSDLRESVLMLVNKMKVQMTIPEDLRTANITIIHKKGNKVDLNNWRGIFVTSVVRGILMKLIYERTYNIIEKNMTDAQIGARKNKGVRNHLFVLNAIICDVMSSKKKESIDINIMDFKQMFDTEELPGVLNAFYDSGVKNDILGLLNEANKDVNFAVKTTHGKTESRCITNKVMQGDVMASLMSSNFVDSNIVKTALRTENVYLYKNKVSIPPLIMQDDTLTVSTCGYKTQKITTLLNTCTSTMGLQFASSKCVRMHVGKTQNENLCCIGQVDSWKEELVTDTEGKKYLKDIFEGKVEMKYVEEKKYLGEIVTKNMKNERNIQEKSNKAFGNIRKIKDTLNERPFGIHTFKAAILLRGGLLLGSLLSNIEAMVNVTETALDKLEKPDLVLQENLLPSTGNASKCFRYLELGITPVKYVIMEKRLQFLKYILDENMESMISQVYHEQKKRKQKR